MSKIFNGGKECANNSFTENMLCRMMGEDFYKVLPNHKVDGATNIAVSITLNGHEIDAEEFFLSLEDEFKYSSEQQAAKLLLGPFSDIKQKIMDVTYQLESIVRDEVRKAFPNLKDEDF